MSPFIILYSSVAIGLLLSLDTYIKYAYETLHANEVIACHTYDTKAIIKFHLRNPF